jgi:hypothetical protein
MARGFRAALFSIYFCPVDEGGGFVVRNGWYVVLCSVQVVNYEKYRQ